MGTAVLRGQLEFRSVERCDVMFRPAHNLILEITEAGMSSFCLIFPTFMM